MITFGCEKMITFDCDDDDDDDCLQQPYCASTRVN